MNRKNSLLFCSLGLIVWAVATIVYRFIGTYFFENSAVAYGLNIVASCILCMAAIYGLMKWRQIEQREWIFGTLCLALPGMFCEVPLLTHFSELMSNMQPETAGAYAAYLFACYTSIISLSLVASFSVRVPKSAKIS